MGGSNWNYWLGMERDMIWDEYKILEVKSKLWSDTNS